MTGRLIAIGDVHGCLSELDRLLAALDPAPEDHLVFVEDYVDRGPDTRGVLARALDLRDRAAAGDGPRCTFLRGNHEQMMLDARDQGGHTLDNWVYNGGGATLLSYGYAPTVQPLGYAGPGHTGPDPDWTRLVPDDHWAFLDATALFLDHPAYLFVHAGADPALTLAENVRGRPGRFLWERRHLAEGADLSRWDRPVVCGHTPHEAPVDLPSLVVVDTGAYHPYVGPRPGALTAVVLPPDGDGERTFVSVPSGPLTQGTGRPAVPAPERS